MWGFSSAGRAPALHAGGQEFESPNLQNKKSNDISYSVFYFLRVKFDEKLPMYFRTFQRSCASELRLECFCCCNKVSGLRRAAGAIISGKRLV